MNRLKTNGVYRNEGRRDHARNAFDTGRNCRCGVRSNRRARGRRIGRRVGESTIALLEAQGFDVKINRIGSAPLDQCVVTDVRNPRERTEFVPVLGDRGGVVEQVVDRNITVTVNCSRR